MLDSKLKNVIEQLYAIPNAPFTVGHRSKYIKESILRASLEYVETPYYIYTKLSNGNGRKIIFMSHLDHPGFVFKNSREATAFGSLYLDKVKNLKPISVFNPNGEYIGDVSITKVYGRDESLIEVDSEFDIPKNSQGLWNVGNVRVEEDKIYGRSHDNDIVTSILLNNLRRVESSEFEIYFLFTKHEEVLQQSSYAFSKVNPLNITHDDIVVNLESMKVYPTTDNPRYSRLDYNSGVVLNVSEATCIYGQNTSERNIAESLVNNISTEKNLSIQRGMAGGTSDARLISMFNLTPNLITLNIPNQFKHNTNDISIVPEEVLVNDVITLDTIIKSIVDGSATNIETNQFDISSEIKSQFPSFGRDVSQQYAGINRRLHISNTYIINRGHYYPQSILETVADMYWKALSYLIYFINRSRSVSVSKR
jgi:putative aminopeptidase FrvX